MRTVNGILTILAGVVINIVLPALLIRWLILRRKRPGKPQKTRNYKIINLPLLILNAVPMVILAFINENMIQWDSEFWEAALLISLGITIVVTIIQTRLTGLWLGPLRAILGAMAGAAAFYALFLLIAVCAIVLYGMGDIRTSYINVNGKSTAITSSDGKVFTDDDGNRYTLGKEGLFYDDFGRSYR